MENHIIVKEVISHAATNEAFTFSLFHTSSHCVDRTPGFDISQSALALDHPPHQYPHELFFDMDINLPFTWADIDHDAIHKHSSVLALEGDAEPGDTNLIESAEYTSDAKEFEFHIAFSEGDLRSDGLMEALSPADDLFYKGKLLPLHLPPRRRMLERLSSIDSTFTEEDENVGTDHGDTLNMDCSTNVAEVCNEAKHLVHPYSCWNLTSRGNEEHRDKGLTLQVRAPTPYIYSREDEHDSFPECYKDPALRMIQHARPHGHTERLPSKKSCKSSVGCSVLLASSKRLGCVEDSTACDEASRVSDLRKWKHNKQRGFSMIKLRAPASLFRSVFNSREFRGLLVYKSAHHQVYHDAPVMAKQRRAVQEEEEEDAGLGNAPFDSLKLKEALDRDKIMSKAKIYIQKYVKRFKSMYVFLSHTYQEQSRNLLESSASLEERSTCSSSSSGSSSSRGRQGTDKHVITKGVRYSVASDAMFSWKHAEAIPSSKHSEDSSVQKHRRYRDAIVHASLMDCTDHRAVTSTKICNQPSTGRSNLLQDMRCRSSACIEVESPIQGAIAHCKQSSTLPTH